MAHTENSAGEQAKQKHTARQVPVGCAACGNRRPGWFCSLGSAVLADLELVTTTISLPAQSHALHPGRGCALPLSDLRRLSEADRRASTRSAR